MLFEIIAPLRRVVQTLVACHSPPELAAGFTLGMIIGLVPKGNLIALSLCVLLFSMRVNKGLGVMAAVLFSCFATSIDPFAHKLGLFVLSAENLQVSYARIYDMPFGPWLGFNNTVTSGSLLFGVYVSYPVYFATRTLAARIERLIVAWLSEMRSEVSQADHNANSQPRIAA
ncbi:MAG: TIGR03546 family protein [Pirellulales bacterium]